jgi:hypothetical protein
VNTSLGISRLEAGRHGMAEGDEEMKYDMLCYATLGEIN